MKSYFCFIRYCIDDRQQIPVSIGDVDWKSLFLFMQQQALLGVGFNGIEKMKRDGVDVPKHLLLKLYTISERIKQRNELLNNRTAEIVRLLDKEGIKCCILKGQGNATMYPNPCLRTPGDIDVWIDDERQKIMEMVRRQFPKASLRYHHVDYPIFKDALVELHFMPASMNNPVYNKRLNKWFEKDKERQFCNYVKLPNGEDVPIPTTDFNIVYQLSHLMHHFFDEGIGLRQMMDYYFVLKNAKVMDKETLARELKYLGLYKFAGAVMYVMQLVFGLEEALMIAPIDAKKGKTLMTEILKGGNFGKHSGLTEYSAGVKYFLKIWRNLQFVCEYPAEALCEPLFRTWHFSWRLCHK